MPPHPLYALPLMLAATLFPQPGSVYRWLPADVFDPPLSDLSRFPDHDEAHRQLGFATDHEEWLQRLRLAWPSYSEAIDVWMEETQQRRLEWDSLFEATRPDCWGDEYRVIRLRELRRLLGIERYTLGQMMRFPQWPAP